MWRDLYKKSNYIHLDSKQQKQFYLNLGETKANKMALEGFKISRPQTPKEGEFVIDY